LCPTAKQSSIVHVFKTTLLPVEEGIMSINFPLSHSLAGIFLHELWKYHERVRSNLKSDIKEFNLDGLSYWETLRVVIGAPVQILSFNQSCKSFAKSLSDLATTRL